MKINSKIKKRTKIVIAKYKETKEFITKIRNTR